MDDYRREDPVTDWLARDSIRTVPTWYEPEKQWAGGADDAVSERLDRDQDLPAASLIRCQFESPAFHDLAAQLPAGRERILLDRHPMVSALAEELRSFPDASLVVERYVESLFEELRGDVEFEHTEQVMVILVACERAAIDTSEITSAIAESTYASLGRLRRFVVSSLSA